MKTIRIIVKGLVQGVSFRYYTQKIAIKLGLTGYVKNLADKGVEIIVVGDETKFQQFLDWVKTGPEGAKVTEIKIEKLNTNFEFDDFKIKY